MKKGQASLVMTACETKGKAEALAEMIVENRLAACVQLQSVTSFYRWKGQINKDEETLLLIKTKADLYPELERFIRRNHEYEIPEILEIPVDKGLGDYMEWLESVTKK